MTGFDETVPPDPDAYADATAVPPDGGVGRTGEHTDTEADSDQAVMGGDDDLRSGHRDN